VAKGAVIYVRVSTARTLDPATQKQIMRMGTLGTSLLRQTLRRSGYSPVYSVEMGGVTVLVGRLVDLAAALTQLSFHPSAIDQIRLRNLAASVPTFTSSRLLTSVLLYFDHVFVKHHRELLLVGQPLRSLRPQHLL
jgi:hypothetical protein